MVERSTSFFRIKAVLAWVAICAFVTLFVAQNYLEDLNPVGNGPWPDLLPRPRSFNLALQIRNYAFLIALVTAVLSLPRRIAIVALVLTLAYGLWTYWVFAHY